MGKNIAISYSLKRKQKKASGGTVESGDKEMNLAEGGEVKDEAPVSQDEAKKFAAGMCPTCGTDRMSKGGEVANDTGGGVAADEKPNEFDDLVLSGGLSDSSSAGNTKGNSGEDKRRKDLVMRAMARKQAKR